MAAFKVLVKFGPVDAAVRLQDRSILKGVAVGKAPPGRLTALEQQVMLAMLHLAPQASGPAIIMYLMRKRQREQKPSPVYAALYRLRDWGYAKAAPGLPTPKPGGRAKTLYSLTEAGLAGLQQSLQPGAKLRRTRSWAGSPLR